MQILGPQVVPMGHAVLLDRPVAARHRTFDVQVFQSFDAGVHALAHDDVCAQRSQTLHVSVTETISAISWSTQGQ